MDVVQIVAIIVIGGVIVNLIADVVIQNKIIVVVGNEILRRDVECEYEEVLVINDNSMLTK